MIEKEPHPPWRAYLLSGCFLLVCAGVAFVFGYWFRDWSQSGARLTFIESVRCYLPFLVSACRVLIAVHGGVPPARMFHYQVLMAMPMIGFLALGVLALWYHLLRRRTCIILSGLSIGGMRDLLLAADYEQKKSRYPNVSGLHMFNGWKLSLGRETRHFNIIGAIGGGKTILMTRMIHAAIKRNDKVLIFDQKGDYTKCVPPNLVAGERHQPLLLAPQDCRSAVWNIAADLEVAQEAIELANRLVVESSNRFFSDSARAVLSVCIIKLMATKPKQWTWAELLQETRQDNDTLLATALKFSRGTNLFLEADFRQMMSTRGTLEAQMGMLNMLASAWPSYEGRQLFSIRGWLRDTTRFGTVIIRHDGQFSTLSDAWIAALYAIAINTVTDSKSLGDDELRRIWFFLDEWAQLPHIQQFQTFITVGRSKGVCVVLGLQDAAQVSQKYGQDALKTLMASVGTTLIVQVNHGETALTLERYFGKTIYVIWKRKPFGARGEHQWVDERHEEAPYKSTEFSTLLGTDSEGVRCLVSGLGHHLYKVCVPHDKRVWVQHRAASVPASWTTHFKIEGALDNDREIAAYISKLRQRQSQSRQE
ncbi:type IV secretion system DNA-binding domain-containing protein [Ochrobactrum sp. AN78]|uniref:type IV secretion system DNA-binding domain-containing protein n=1 Tax=Ochrobactrum sp. AN78 TaxID=3039853 RepID=UPI002989CC8C|nr:type IV secretion system DNA-binding domain-containing protein [Ochrobactrum sp. AN78]MDH7792560.1 hypothetical protein [Ochrobactrum sp. AN78]